MNSRAPVYPVTDLSTPDQQTPVSTVSPAVTHARRVLIADDNRDSADTLAVLLQYRGCEVRVAYDGEDALTAFAEAPADLVLLDLGMPRLGGHDACRAMRALPGGESAVIVAVTGWGQARDRLRSQDAGFDDHVVKPVSHETLCALLTKNTARTSDQI